MESPFTALLHDLRVIEEHEDQLERDERERELRRYAPADIDDGIEVREWAGDDS